jgi:hypothetical protein
MKPTRARDETVETTVDEAFGSPEAAFGTPDEAFGTPDVVPL